MLKVVALLALVSVGLTDDARPKENLPVTKIEKQNQGLQSLNELDLPHHPDVEEVDVSNNAIQNIKEDAFKTNTKLKKLNLSGNTKLILPEYSTLLISNLEELNLSNCNISVLPIAILDGLVNLKVVDLSNNPLQNFKVITFSNLLNLEKLILPNLDNKETITELCNENDKVIIETTTQSLTCTDINNGKWDGNIKINLPNSMDLHTPENLLNIEENETVHDEISITNKNENETKQETEDEESSEEIEEGDNKLLDKRDNQGDEQVSEIPEVNNAPDETTNSSATNNEKLDKLDEAKEITESTQTDQEQPHKAASKDLDPTQNIAGNKGHAITNQIKKNEEQPHNENNSTGKDNNQEINIPPSAVSLDETTSKDTEKHDAVQEKSKASENTEIESKNLISDHQQPNKSNAEVQNTRDENKLQSETLNTTQEHKPDDKGVSEGLNATEDQKPTLKEQNVSNSIDVIDGKVNISNQLQIPDSLISQQESNVKPEGPTISIQRSAPIPQIEVTKTNENKNIIIPNSPEISQMSVVSEIELKNVVAGGLPVENKNNIQSNQQQQHQAKQDDSSEVPTGASTPPSTGTNILIFLVVAVIISGIAAFGYRFYKTRTYRQTNTQEPIEKELQEIVTDKKCNGPSLSNVLEEEPLMQKNENGIEIKETDETKQHAVEGANHSSINTKPYVPITSISKIENEKQNIG